MERGPRNDRAHGGRETAFRYRALAADRHRAALPDHAVYFRPQFKTYYGLVMFIKKDIAVREEGELFVYKDRGYFSEEDIGDHSRNIQYASLDTPPAVAPSPTFTLYGMGRERVIATTACFSRITSSDF